MEATVVLFPAGLTRAEGRVVSCRRLGQQWAVVTSSTPFHPLDHTWPDQPADRGLLGGLPVVDCATGAIGPDGDLRIGADIPARRGDPGWTWVVAHLLDPDAGEPPAEGQDVVLEVDEDYRRSLSMAHTACHLAALALNRACTGLWRKDPPRRDSLGSPDLDGLAIERSSISPLTSLDEYRLGKSIRKKGLDTAALLDGLDGLAGQVTAQLAAWIATAADVEIDTGGDDTIGARRTWICRLPEGEARYPCGGTHVDSLAQLPASTRVQLRATADGFAADTVVA